MDENYFSDYEKQISKGNTGSNPVLFTKHTIMAKLVAAQGQDPCGIVDSVHEQQ